MHSHQKFTVYLLVEIPWTFFICNAKFGIIYLSFIYEKAMQFVILNCIAFILFGEKQN